MATTNEYRSNANASTEGKLARDVYKEIMHLGEPTDAPLMTLKGGMRYDDGGGKPKEVSGKINTMETSNVTFEIIEKDPLARSLSAYAEINAAATALDVGHAATSAKHVTPGDTLYNKRTGEHVFVISKDSDGFTVNIRRGVQGTAAAIIEAGDEFYIDSWAGKEGGSKRALCSQIAATRTATTQILKRSFGISETMANVDTLVTPKDWDEEMTQAGYNHKLDIENACWMGGGGSSTDVNGNTVLFMKGVVPTIAADATRVFDCQRACDEKYFFEVLAPKLFNYGPKVKTLFADAPFIAKINSWPNAKQMTQQKETEYGFDIQILNTPFGKLNLILCGAFANFLPSSDQGYGVCLDLQHVYWRPLKGRDTKMKEGIQTNGDDAREGQFITEGGLMVKLIKFHSIIKNV
jgi:hypothetical protein